MNKIDMSTATAATTEVQINGSTYVVGRLQLRDYGYLEQWMRDCLVRSGRDAMKGLDLSNADKALVLKEAYVAAGKVSFTSDQATGFLNSIEGSLRAAWLSMRRYNTEGPDKHPMTLDEVSAILDEDSMLPIVEFALERVAELDDEISKKADAGDDSDPTIAAESSQPSPEDTPASTTPPSSD